MSNNHSKLRSKDATYVGSPEEIVRLMEADDACPDLSGASSEMLNKVYEVGEWWRRDGQSIPMLLGLRAQIRDGRVPYLSGWMPYQIGSSDNRYIDIGSDRITYRENKPDRLIRQYARPGGGGIVPSRLPHQVRMSLENWRAATLKQLHEYMTAGTGLTWEKQQDGGYALVTDSNPRDLRVADRHVYRLVAPTSKKEVLLSFSERLESWDIFDPHTKEQNPYALLEDHCKIERVSPSTPGTTTVRRGFGTLEAELMENFVLACELLGKTNQHVLGIVSSNHFRRGDVKVLDVELIRSQATYYYYAVDARRFPYRGQAILAGDWEATAEIAALLNHFMRPRRYLYGHDDSFSQHKTDVGRTSKLSHILWPHKFPGELRITYDEVTVPTVQSLESSAMIEMYKNIMRQVTSSTTTTQVRVPITAEIELADHWKNLVDWKNRADPLTGTQHPLNDPQRRREELDAIGVALRLLQKRIEKP